MTDDYRAKDLCWTDLEVRSFDGLPLEQTQSRVLSFIASDESVDSHEEIVEQDWIFDRFDKNPAILYNHNKPAVGSAGLKREETLPIGKGVGRSIVELPGVGKRLKIDVEFPTADLSPFADQVYRYYKTGFMKAASVGFRPHDVTAEKAPGDRKRFRLRKNELYELSLLPLGSNANAISLSPEDRESHREFLESLAEKSPAATAAQEKEIPMTEPVVETVAAEAPVTLGANTDTDRLKTLEIETVALREKVAKHEKIAAESDVDAIVAKKIVPAQRADFLELRTLSADLFARITSALPELEITKTVVTPEPIIKNKSTDAESAGQAAARLLRPATEK